MKPPISANAFGKLMGIDAGTVMKLYRAGVIDAEIKEGRLVRFDAEKCRKVLSDRAKANRNEDDGDLMLPTY